MMSVPANLKHKPVFCVNDYELIDGPYAGETDAKGLSLGLAQWNDRGNIDISAKVWRYTGGKWSRQSEELPLNRVIDLTLLICQVKQHLSKSSLNEQSYNSEHPTIDQISLQGSNVDINVCTDNPMINTDIQLFSKALNDEDKLINERLQLLSNLLKNMGY